MYLTINQVAERLSVCTKTIYRRVKSGEIPAVRIGEKAIRINEADIDRLLKIVTTEENK